MMLREIVLVWIKVFRFGVGFFVGGFGFFLTNMFPRTNVSSILAW